LVVVPAVGVVIGDDDRGVLPLRKLLQVVDGVDDKPLLVNGIGIGCVAILVAGGLQETHAGQLARISGRPEGRQVVLVVGLVGGADHVRGRRGQVMRVRCRRVVLERLVVRNVVALGSEWTGAAL